MLKSLKQLNRRLRLKRLKRLNPNQLYSQAKTQALFDADWYQEYYGKKFKSGFAAFNDYLGKSKYAPVNPCPAFDSVAYYRANMDVYHAGVSPLSHYLSKGKAEGRPAFKARQPWISRDNLQLDSEISPLASKLKVAAQLHIFYEDYIGKFAALLDGFPVDIDLFVSVSKQSMVGTVKKVYQSISCVRQIEVVVAPNRGRNFGPLLVDFAVQVQSYDLLLHLHSKKSLYSGREQTQWSDYLSEYLLGDKTIVTKVLNAFAEYQDLGIYYPTTFWMMPGWVNHVTMNKAQLGGLCERLGIKAGKDFLAYPVGGMFWCRPLALDRIFKQNFTLDDLPQEPLPNDGSLLHALERVVGLVAENDGYKQFFYDPSTAKFTRDSSFITQKYRSGIAEMKSLLLPFKCLSFDVFDTLLCRKYTFPDYAKYLLGKELVEAGYFSTPMDFVELRNESEFELRKQAKFKGDVGIEAVYKAIGQKLSLDTVVSKEWANREFELDLYMVEGKDEIVNLFNEFGASGKQLWVISDTYYTPSQIRLMLKKAGVVEEYRLLVSSHEQCRKDNGTMWKHVKSCLKQENIKSFIHIGDNVVSDAQIPGDHGLANFHILNPLDKWEALCFPPALKYFDEGEILKWGPLVKSVGRNPFIGE